MSHHSIKKKKVLKKRCGRCDELFDIPKVKKSSKAFQLVIQFTPCPHCFFVEDPKNPKYDRSGRCRDCSIPFTMVKHKAKGYCHRCLQKKYRLEHSTK